LVKEEKEVEVQQKKKKKGDASFCCFKPLLLFSFLLPLRQAG